MSPKAHTPHHDQASLQSTIAEKDERIFSVLLANSQPRIGTYIALAKAIQDAGHLAVVVPPQGVSPSDEELVGFESVEFCSIPVEAVKHLDGVDLFFSSEVVFDVAPPGAVTVGIFHSLPDQGLSRRRFAANFADNLRKQPTIIRTFDYLVAAVRQRETHWDPNNYAFIQKVYPPAFLSARRPFLDIVPGGYPKLDYSRRILASTTSPSCIIYSPTSQRSRLTRVREDGEAILSALLRAFPGWTIVFRPYPDTSDIGQCRDLTDAFAANPSFVFDDSTTGVQYQRDCAVTVTDSSSSAITFAVAKRRPLVFVDLKDSGRDPGSARVVAPVRNPFGFAAKTVPAMIEAVRSGIDDAPLWEEAITEEAEKYIYNPGSAARYLAAHLRRFADRQSHPDWLSVERRPWVATGDPRAAERHLDRLRSTWPEQAGANASQVHDEIAEYLESAPQVVGQ